jgi:uncharacterized protein (DUF983 family)
MIITHPFSKGTKLYSIIHLKCPKCQEANLFSVRNPYKLKTVDDMPHYCPSCGEDFQREVGYYYGAMMISHALTTVIAVVIHVFAFYFYGWAILPNLVPIVVVITGLFPVVFRVSRAIWINLFVSYDPNYVRR